MVHFLTCFFLCARVATASNGHSRFRDLVRRNKAQLSLSDADLEGSGLKNKTIISYYARLLAMNTSQSLNSEGIVALGKTHVFTDVELRAPDEDTLNRIFSYYTAKTDQLITSFYLELYNVDKLVRLNVACTDSKASGSDQNFIQTAINKIKECYGVNKIWQKKMIDKIANCQKKCSTVGAQVNMVQEVIVLVTNILIKNIDTRESISNHVKEFKKEVINLLYRQKAVKETQNIINSLNYDIQDVINNMETKMNDAILVHVRNLLVKTFT